MKRNNSKKKNNRKLRIVFILWFLQFFTSASWGILPSTNLIDPADNSYIYITQFFLSPPFLFFFILELRNQFLSVSSDLYCVIFCSLLLLHPPLFFSTVLSLPGSVFSHSGYSLHFLIFIVFFSNLLFFSLSLFLYSTYLSLMFYWYSICSVFLILHLFFVFHYSSLSNTYLLSIFLLLLSFLNTFF